MEEIKDVYYEEKSDIESGSDMLPSEKKKKIYVSEKASQIIIFVALLALVVLLPMARIVSDIFEKSDTMIVQSVFLIVYFGITLIIIGIEGVHGRISWKQYLLPYACLIIIWIFSFIASLNVALPKFAFLGNAYRGEGLLQIGGYYGIFIIASLLVNEKYRRAILYTFLCLASVFSILGIFQFLNIYMFGTVWDGMASVGFGNPNFFATFTLLFSGVAMGGFWLYNKDSRFFHPFPWWNRIVWFILVVISHIGCITARSSVAYVGLIMMFLLLIFLDIVSKKRRLREILLMIISVLVVMLVLNLASGGRVVGELSSTFVEIEKEGSVFGDTVGTNRMKIWKEVIGLLPMYWLYGCGIEHLGYVHLFTYGLDAEFEVTDRAHNEYLNLWISQGIIPLILYLVFLFALFIPGILQYIKKNSYDTDDIKMVAIIPFFGYIAQAFFNICVIAVAPYFWLICGFLLMKRKSSSSADVVQEADISKEEVKEVPIESVSVVKEE